MIVEISRFLSILATALFFLTGSFSFFNNTKDISTLVSKTYSHGFLFLTASFLIYVWLAVTDNFSVQYIASHSNSNLPTFYKGDEITPPDISEYKICTITAMSKFNKILNLNNIYDNITNNNYDNIKAIKYKDTTVGKFKKQTSFYNQITIIINNDKKDINVKIFKNGQIQITGCKEINEDNTLPEGDHAISYITEIINNIENSYEEYDKKLSFEDVVPVMINCSLSLNIPIDRVKCYKLINAKGYLATFGPNIYAGINFEYNNDYDKLSTILIFQTGKIIITGVSKLNELENTYDFLCKFIKDNYKDIIKYKNK